MDTLKEKNQHRRVDSKTSELPKPEDLEEEKIQSRSVTLSSDTHRVIAKIDLVEGVEGRVAPVDYKHGHPRETDGGLDLWPSDRVQLAVQGLVLRENTGTNVRRASHFTPRTRQRVPSNF